MKNIAIKWPYTILGILASLLLGYFCYAIAENDENNYIAGIGSSVCFISTIIPLIGMSHESCPLNANLKTLSGVSVFIMLISNFCFAFFGVNMPYYVIINGILLIVYWVIYLKLANKTDI